MTAWRSVRTVAGFLLLVSPAVGCSWLASFDAQNGDTPSATVDEVKAPSKIVETIIIQSRSVDENMAELLKYSRQVAQYSDRRIAEEYQIVLEQNGVKPLTRNMLKLAMLLSLPSTKIKNETRAYQILKEVVEHESRHSPVLSEYASVLIESLDKQLASAKRAAVLGKALKRERAQRQQVEKQLDALKSIEESISSRNITSGDDL